MAALDGEPRAAREVVQEILGRPPSPSEFNAAHRAMRLLIERGQLRGWLEPNREHRLVLWKVDAWISDGDTGTSTEQQTAVDPLQQFTDRAWRAFRVDVSYATEICEVAATLARYERRDPGLANPRDGDLAQCTEPGPAQIAPVVRPRAR